MSFESSVAAPNSDRGLPKGMPPSSSVSPIPAEPPERRLVEMLMAGRLQQAIYAAAALGVADVLAQGPLDIGEISLRTKSHPDALQRLLRALAGYGIFAEDDQQRYALTPMASLLRTGTPMSMRPVALWCGTVAQRVFGDIEHTMRSGKPAFDHVFGMEFFDYLDSNRDVGEMFDAFMERQTAGLAATVPTAYAFDEIGTLVDVGGGRGQLLAAILKSVPSMRGVLFDRPRLMASADEYLKSQGVLDRCTVLSGDISTAVPDGGDAYLLKSIVHGVDDATAVAWLMACRRAMRDDARLLLVEMIMPEGNTPHPSKLMDLLMLVGSHGGRERTEVEFSALLSRAGFTLSKIVRTASPYCVIEALPA